MRRVPWRRLMLNTINSATQCSVMRHPVQWNVAQCNIMLPPSVQSIIHAEGLRYRSCSSIRTMSGFEPKRVRCGLAENLKQKAAKCELTIGEPVGSSYEVLMPSLYCDSVGRVDTFKRLKGLEAHQFGKSGLRCLPGRGLPAPGFSRMHYARTIQCREF